MLEVIGAEAEREDVDEDAPRADGAAEEIPDGNEATVEAEETTEAKDVLGVEGMRDV